jgi:hypothetical protein
MRVYTIIVFGIEEAAFIKVPGTVAQLVIHVAGFSRVIPLA